MKDIEAIERSAQRADALGEHARAIMWRNSAWLADHPEGWLAYMESEAQQCGNIPVLG